LHAAGSLSVRNGEADPLITKALSPQFQLWIGPHQLEVILSDCEKDDEAQADTLVGRVLRTLSD